MTAGRVSCSVRTLTRESCSSLARRNARASGDGHPRIRHPHARNRRVQRRRRRVRTSDAPRWARELRATECPGRAADGPSGRRSDRRCDRNAVADAHGDSDRVANRSSDRYADVRADRNAVTGADVDTDADFASALRNPDVAFVHHGWIRTIVHR